MSLPVRHAFYLPDAMRLLLMLVVCGGCASSFELRNPFPQQDKAAAEAQLASHSAAQDYPRGATIRETRVSAIVDRDAKSITIVNPTDQDLYAVRAWVNGEYVAYINTLPARRTAQLPANNFVDSAGKTLALPQTRVDSVEIQMNGELYRALGPALVPSEADKPKRGVEFSFPPRRG